MSVGLSEDHISMSWFSIFQLLLKVSTSVLILAEVEEFALEIFNSDTSESVDCLSGHLYLTPRGRLTFSVSFGSLVLQTGSTAGVKSP
jgi:hypothetical protein